MPVRLPVLLARCAELFAENGRMAREDPIGTYRKSTPVDRLTHFVSHSWKSSRIEKYVALGMHFNVRRSRVEPAACGLRHLRSPRRHGAPP